MTSLTNLGDGIGGVVQHLDDDAVGRPREAAGGSDGQLVHLSLVVHGDLDEHHGVGGGAELDVRVAHWLPLVSLLGAAPAELDGRDDRRHVQLLNH